MKFARIFRIGGVTAAVILATGCATQSQTQAGIGAGAGCVAGAVFAKMVGENPGKFCAGGAAVGGTIGYLKGRQADLDLARTAAQDIQRNGAATGSTVQLTTRSAAVPVSERASMGNATQVDTLDKMVVNVPKTLVAKRDPRASETFSRVGNYVSNANGPAVVTVKADTETEFRYIVSEIRGGYSSGKYPEPNKVQYKFEPSPRGSQASVEVAHTA